MINSQNYFSKINYTQNRMKAIIHTTYGPPEVAQLKEIDKPIPGDHELLVRVMYSTVNRTDCGFRSAEYFISRFWSGLFRPKYKTLGCEFAGVVEATGKSVTTFKIGDRIFGYNDKKFGGHAEYLTIDENDAVVLIPAKLTYETVAAGTEGAHYALCDIRASKIKPGQNVLVYGATGAIGSAAVQILKHMGVTVTAVCNTKNVELIKSLGADVVIDYEKQDFTKTKNRFDFVFDAVGKTSIAACKPIMNKQSIYISTELGNNGQNVFYALFAPLMGNKKVLFPMPTISKQDVEFLCQLMENGEFKPVIDRVYKLEEIVDAYKYVESGQKTGNVLIKI